MEKRAYIFIEAERAIYGLIPDGIQKGNIVFKFKDGAAMVSLVGKDSVLQDYCLNTMHHHISCEDDFHNCMVYDLVQMVHATFCDRKNDGFTKHVLLTHLVQTHECAMCDTPLQLNKVFGFLEFLLRANCVSINELEEE